MAPEDTREDERRHPSTIGGAFYIVILLATIAGLVVVYFGDWRAGVHICAGAVLAAALLRAVLPRRDAGMLAVRARWIDVSVLTVLGVAMWFLVSTLPSLA